MSELESLGTSASLAGVGIYTVKKFVDGLDRLFGPMTDEIAEVLRRSTEYTLRNVGRATANANQKTSRDLLDSGEIPFRAAMKILAEAATADDDVLVEYVGGVLASSRSPSGKDDRGVVLAALISRLSSDDLRAHYIYYSTITRLLHGTNVRVFQLDDLTGRGSIFVPWSEFGRLMGGGEGDGVDYNDIFARSTYPLVREGLIQFSKAGEPSHLAQELPDVSEAGVIVAATVPGIQLYLWALGKGQLSVDAITDSSVELPTIAEFGTIERAFLTRYSNPSE